MATATAATLMGRTGALGVADAPLWSIIPGKTMSMDIHRIFTVLELEATTVVSAAVGLMVVVVMAVGTGVE